MAEKYMRGLCLAVDPQMLRQGQYAQFRNLTSRTGAVTPVSGDGTHATATWEEQQLGTNIVSETFSINGTAGWLAYVAQAGGTVTLRDPAGTTSAIALAASGTAPTESLVIPRSDTTGFFAADNCIPYGSSVHVAFAYTMAGGYHSSLSPVGTFTNDTSTLAVLSNSTNPEYGATITGSASGATATVAGYFDLGANANFALRGVSGTFGTSETVTWQLGTGTAGTGTTSGTVGTTAYAYIQMTAGALPAGASGINAYVLGDTGSYFLDGTSGSAAYTLGKTALDSMTDGFVADLYDGPLDANGYPETLVVPGTCQTLTLHKGCLFLGEGNLVRWSEGMLTGVEVRWFRDGYTIDVGSTVWAMISRGEVLEVWTALGVKYIVGNAPFFEVRSVQLAEPAVSRFSIVGVAGGTFYHANDGMRLFIDGQGKAISQDYNDDWFDAVAAPASTIGGASDGVYYLTDATGRCLIFDWEASEFRDRTFSAQPSGFRWNPTSRYLVAKVSGAYVTIETAAATAVAWTIQLPTVAPLRPSKLPGSLFLDHDGETALSIFVDGVEVVTSVVTERTYGRLRLPAIRGSRWYAVLSETSAAAGFTLHGLKWGPQG